MIGPLKEGDQATGWSGVDVWQRDVSWPDGKTWYYLSFHRFASCPFCQLRTHELIKNHHRFLEKNVEIISIWPSTPELLLEYAGGDQTPFPMISDPQKQIYRSFGVVHKGLSGALRLMFHPGLILNSMKSRKGDIKPDADPMLFPAGFLIDPEGRVAMAYYGRHYGDHTPIDSILSHTNFKK